MKSCRRALVTLTRLIKDPVADDELGTLMIDFNLGFLDNLSSSASWDRGAEPTLVIVNTEGSIVFNSSPFDKEIIEAVTPGTEKLKVSGSISASDTPPPAPTTGKCSW